MKRLLFAVLAVLIVVPAVAQTGNFIQARGEKIPGRYVVVFDDSALLESAAVTAENLAAAHQGKVEAVWSAALRGAVITGLDERRAKALANQPGVKWVEEDAVVTIAATQNNPPSWGLDRIDQRALPLSNSYTYNFDGTGVTAYIIDTGIRITHNDFGGRASWGTNTVDSNNSDCNGHGTHVAGTVGGSAHGVAKNVDLVAVKVLNCSGSGSVSSVVGGIDWVTDRHNTVGGPSVANMSLGGGASSTIDNAVNNSVNAGVFHAVAAGNSNANACNSSPARAAQAYTVGSTTSSDARSSFSNFGTCVNIFAPGSSITSTWNTSDNATNTISGTSMASPHVAGAASLVLDENPGFSPAQVAAELTDTATCGVVGNPGSGSPNLLLYTLGGTDPNCGEPPPPPPGDCPDGYTVFTGTATSGSSLATSAFSGSGTFHGILLCDTGAADLDLYLDKESCGWWSCSFSAVASSTSAQCNEEINHSNTSGTYRWRVVHFSGPSEGFTLCVNQP